MPFLLTSKAGRWPGATCAAGYGDSKTVPTRTVNCLRQAPHLLRPRRTRPSCSSRPRACRSAPCCHSGGRLGPSAIRSLLASQTRRFSWKYGLDKTTSGTPVSWLITGASLWVCQVYNRLFFGYCPRTDKEILKYLAHGLWVTWASVPANLRDGFERYLADRYPPLVGDCIPNVAPIAGNSPRR